ncbi:penicillin-binding protein [Nocardiopsis sp. TSRI0078]|uniref:penicillin-binding transpeptidase domain-containing protein n=1 Tax=unclassified Nocardiopsis TaxID=2649073 RepID=UPI00093A6AEA|nr:penicillin-binding transpeptidase domain-containing protein [Nocardiopsis sp. TSRI0078]OKI16903.1 penicillin-binding protein [Nocardiopsis sp. TSRI0078]
MDERSPRQPDSSGPPEETDENPAHAPRPENPYRIPRRPQGAPPTDPFGPGGHQPPRPTDPAPPPGSAFGAPPESLSHERPDDAWGAPPREDSAPHAWADPRPEEQPDDAWGAPPHGGSAPHAWADPRPEQRPAASWSGPEGSDAPDRSWDAPRSGGSPTDSWDAPSAPGPNRPEGWDTPYPSAQGPAGGWSDHGGGAPGGPGPAHDSWQEPSPTGYEAPSGRDGSWDEDPYPGGPVHHGDTPYPGGPPEPEYEAAASAPRSGQRPAEGFEYLYGGASPGGPGGPGHPDGPDYSGAEGYDPAPPPPRRSRRGLVIGVVSAVVVLLLVGGAASWYVLTMPRPEETTAEYEAAWEAQDYERLAAVTTGGDAASVLSGIDAGLGIESLDVEVGAPSTEGGGGSASYEVTVSLTNAGDWGWEGELPLVREDGEWWVDFSPEVAYPGLGEGQVLARTAVWGERGHILAADGTRIDTTDVSGSLQMLAGSLGEATEEDVERLGPAYSVGDTIGVGGLQRTYEERLAGEAATTIVMADAAAAEDPASLEVTEENTVATLDGSDGEDITTSIDMAVQDAASNAIIGSGDPAGMVALRPSTGEILAAVNVPGGMNRAFEGQYAPGSTFKVVSYSALLDNGVGVDTPMNCTEEYDPGGWTFTNAGGAAYGAQSMTQAFATSCNTALVQQVVDRIDPGILQASAEQFGMNAPLDVGVPTFEPSFPTPDGNVLLGAQSIGQGQILTSPLHMATVPAAVADGSWRHPVLVTDPVREGMPEPRPVTHADTLRTMMRAVVTEGTAKDLSFQGEVYGKTGTAEYGTPEDADEDGNLPSHAWMIGFKGDVAFAVVVEGGGGGSSVAGPLAVKFANAL